MPRLAGIQLLGLAVASALAPYLAIILKGVDPSLPFFFSAAAVGVSALALVVVERGQPAAQPSEVAAEPPGPTKAARGAWAFLLGIALVSQIFHLNSRLPNGVLLWWLGIVAVPWADCGSI